MVVVAGVAVLEGPMYAVGGHDGWSYLSTVERCDDTFYCLILLFPLFNAQFPLNYKKYVFTLGGSFTCIQ